MRGLKALSFTTFWNVRSYEYLRMPPRDFGEYLNFVGTLTHVDHRGGRGVHDSLAGCGPPGGNGYSNTCRVVSGMFNMFS